MSRTTVVIGLLSAITALSATIAVVVIKADETSKPTMTEEQRAVREKFFGSGNEPPLIKKGQEMRPKW